MHRPEPSADRQLAELYLELASECFFKAAASADRVAAEALTRMGHRYVGQAAALDRSPPDGPLAR
jgi:hypothetical protein